MQLNLKAVACFAAGFLSFIGGISWMRSGMRALNGELDLWSEVIAEDSKDDTASTEAVASENTQESS